MLNQQKMYTILQVEYDELGLFEDSNKSLNCHNQFLEIWMELGILGVIVMFVLLFYPIVTRTYYHKFLYGSLVIISIIAFLSESVLNRLWGIAFFVIFYTILTARVDENPIQIESI